MPAPECSRDTHTGPNALEKYEGGAQSAATHYYLEKNCG